jgi:hypothetical protein
MALKIKRELKHFSSFPSLYRCFYKNIDGKNKKNLIK